MPDFLLESRANQHWYTSGMDHPDMCRDKQHYQNYPWEVEYRYNQRGFRDADWPFDATDLKHGIWCVGDSFTVGIGAPYDHTWPQMLQQRSGCRTINVSMDGASNDWIARKSQRILQEIQPRHMVIMWSYLARREKPNPRLQDEGRRLQFDITALEQKDIHNFQRCFESVTASAGATDISMFLIPKFARFDGDRMWNEIKGSDWPFQVPRCVQELEALPDFVKHELSHEFHCWHDLVDYVELRQIIQDRVSVVPQLDTARDGHHFDRLTSAWVVDHVVWTAS